MESPQVGPWPLPPQRSWSRAQPAVGEDKGWEGDTGISPSKSRGWGGLGLGWVTQIEPWKRNDSCLRQWKLGRRKLQRWQLAAQEAGRTQDWGEARRPGSHVFHVILGKSLPLSGPQPLYL